MDGGVEMGTVGDTAEGKKQAVRLVRDKLREVVETMLSRGARLPICYAGLGANMAMMYGRFQERMDDTWEFKVLASYPEGEDIQLPLNIMFQDSAGLSARVSVGGMDVAIGGPASHEKEAGH